VLLLLLVEVDAILIFGVADILSEHFQRPPPSFHNANAERKIENSGHPAE